MGFTLAASANELGLGTQGTDTQKGAFAWGLQPSCLATFITKRLYINHIINNREKLQAEAS